MRSIFSNSIFGQAQLGQPVGALRQTKSGARWLPRRVGQLVSPQVNVQAPVSVGLGPLPLSIGLFAGAGLSVLLGANVDRGWPRTIAYAVAAGLGLAGAINLVLPQPAKPGSAPTSAPGQAAREAAAYQPSSPEAFALVTGRITQPRDFDTVPIRKFDTTYPVRLEFTNRGEGPVAFEADLTGEEDPSPLGSEATASSTVHVELAPGQTKLVDVAMPSATWALLVVYIEITLTLYKRSSSGARERLDYKSIVVR